MDIFVLVACESLTTSRALCERMRGTPGAGIEWEAVDQAALCRRLTAPTADILILEHDGANESQPPWLWRDGRPVRMMLMGNHWDMRSVGNAIRYGASGCIDGNEAPELLRRAVRKVHAGEAWFSRQVIFELVQDELSRRTLATSVVEEVPPAGLTTREDEILRLIGTGLSNKEIGRRLDISDKTVKTHLHRIYVKLNRSGRFKAFLAQPGAPVAPSQDLSWATLGRLSGPAG